MDCIKLCFRVKRNVCKLVLSKLTQIHFNGTNFIYTVHTFFLTRGPTRSWRNGDAQCCQLSNIADVFINFFPSKKHLAKKQVLLAYRYEIQVTPYSWLLDNFSYSWFSILTYNLYLQPEFRKCWDVLKIWIKWKLKDFQSTWAKFVFTIWNIENITCLITCNTFYTFIH